MEILIFSIILTVETIQAVMGNLKGNILFIFIFSILLWNQVNAQTEKIDSLRKTSEIQVGEEQVKTFLKLAKELLMVSPDQTITIGENALLKAIETKNKQLICQAHLTIGSGFASIGKFVQSKSHIEEGLKLARELNDGEKICTGLNALAVYEMNTGDYEKAITLFYQTIGQARQNKSELQVAMIRFNIGAILTNMGKWSKGLKEFNLALEYFKQTGNTRLIGQTLMNIAVNYSSWGDYKMSLSYYEKSLEYIKQNGDKAAEASVLNNIGEIYKDTGDYEKALAYYKKALDIGLILKSKLHEAVPLIGLAEAYWKQDQLDKSENYAKEALALFNETQMLEGVARSNYILAEVYLGKKQYDMALSHAFTTKELADKTGIKDIQEKNTLLLSQIYSVKGDIKEAFRFHKEYVIIKDSLYNETHIQHLTQLRTELELKDKEGEIELLQKDNQIKNLQLKRQKNQAIVLIAFILMLSGLIVVAFRFNKTRKKANNLLIQKNKKIMDQHHELTKVNETKDLFLTIIGHDLRNPIGAFRDSLVQLDDYKDMFTEEEKRQIISSLREQSENTYFLLDNVLSWAKTQKHSISFKAEQFPINQIIHHNISLHSHFTDKKKIKIITNLEDNHKVVADQNMVNLILRNLISNAIKFTNEGGKITINAKKLDPGKIQVSVADNGVGITEEVQKCLFNKNKHHTSFGTQNEKGSGLGLILCSEFVAYNGGEIWVESIQGQGSTFYFTLKQAK